MNNLRQSISIKNSMQQSVFITPQMKQSIAILQMPIQELAVEIANILEINPVLEHLDNDNEYDFDDIDGDNDSNEQIEDVEAPSSESDIADTISSDDWDEYIGYDKLDDISYKPLNDEVVDFEAFTSSEESLYDFLMNQLKVAGLGEDDRDIGEFIIGNLSDDGYFRLDCAECCDELNCEEEDFEYVLDVVKTFDPTGIASQTFAQCVMAQLRELTVDQVYIELADELLTNCSSELTTFKYDDILRKMSIERDTLDYLLEIIKKTDPRPGLNYKASDIKVVVPDIFIVPNGDKFDILLNEGGLPPVRLNNYYTKMLKDKSLDGESKQYIKEKVKNALWVIESLQKRQKAIYKVAEILADAQADFIRDGDTRLKPLRLKEVAEITELHESTVSRVTAGKYAMTPRGMIELKSFFSKSFDSEEGDMSVALVKSKIKELIEAEKPAEPLSDQKIVEILDSDGIKIARRTVAKYRDEMNILTMSQRKRLRG